jgi:hypothetical protein
MTFPTLPNRTMQAAFRLGATAAIFAAACGGRSSFKQEGDGVAGQAGSPGGMTGGWPGSSGGWPGSSGGWISPNGWLGGNGPTGGVSPIDGTGATGGTAQLPCGQVVCDPHAYCEQSEAGPTCICMPGYAGPGEWCFDVDECASGSHACDPNARCTNLEGSYACDCNPGYTGNGWDCTDIDECATGQSNCSANATCLNTLGGFTCLCNPPYVGDGVTCSVLCPDVDLEQAVPTSERGTTLNRSDFYTARDCFASPGSPDFTATFTPLYTGTYRFDTVGSDLDTVLAVLDGPCGGGQLGCNDDNPWGSGLHSEVLVRLRAGQTVTAVVDGYDGETGDFVLNLTREPCPDAVLSGSPPLTFTDTTVGSDSFHTTSCGGAWSAPDFTLLYTAESSGTVEFNTIGSDYDTVLAILSGQCGGEEVICNDDSYSVQSSVSTYLDEGQTVTVVITGYGGGFGDFVLNIIWPSLA